MITYFPRIYENETICSIGSRYAKECRMGYYEMVHTLFGGSGQQNINSMLYADIATLFSNLPDEYPYTQQQMIDEHTVLPLYKINCRKEDYLGLIDSKTLSNNASLRKLAYCSNQKNKSERVKYCELCIEEDKDVYGEAYLHCQHQLGGVLVCYKHGIPLKYIDLKITNSVIDINNINKDYACKYVEKLNDEEIEGAYEIAKKVDFLLVNHKLLDVNHTKQVYINSLIAQKLLDGSLFNQSEIRQRIIDRYNIAFLEKLGCTDLINEDGAQIGNIYKEDKFMIDPIKNIVFVESLMKGEIGLIINKSTDEYIDRMLGSNIEDIEEYKIYSSKKTVKDKIRKLYRYRVLNLKQKKIDYCRIRIREELPNEYLWLRNNDKQWLDSQFPKNKFEDENLMFTLRKNRYRKRLVGVQKQNPKYSRTEICNQIGRTYMWLKNNDEEWWKEQLGILEESMLDLKVKYRGEVLQAMDEHPEYGRYKIKQATKKECDWLSNNDSEWLKANLPLKVKRNKMTEEEKRKQHTETLLKVLNDGTCKNRTNVKKKCPGAYRWLKENKKEWLEERLNEELVTSCKNLRERYRTTILKMIHDKPKIGRKRIFKLASKEYVWLQKNDHEWLVMNLPLRKERDKLTYEEKKEKYTTIVMKILEEKKCRTRKEVEKRCSCAYKWLQKNEKKWLEKYLDQYLETSKQNKKERYKKTILELLCNNPDIDRKEIRKSVSKEYKWLRRNDLEWFNTNLASEMIVSLKILKINSNG